ncbi:MAG: hypothetical protein IPI81_03400 [Flavobacteriales bacterium]|nr:hypothetical protein [Flavobacteriales bacterium]
MEPILLIAILLLLIVAVLLLILRRQKPDDRMDGLLQRVNSFNQTLGSFQSSLKEDFRLGRDEHSNQAKETRAESATAFKEFRLEVATALDKLSTDNTAALDRINKTLTDKVAALIEASERATRLARRIWVFGSSNCQSRPRKTPTNYVRISQPH